MSEVTRILSAIEAGEPQATSQLLPLVYRELRELAARKMAREAPGQTLTATALVHEAYLRLAGPGTDHTWDSRGHFFAAAAEAMRRILVDNARRKRSLKRGGRYARKKLDESRLRFPEPSDDLLALDEALDKLAEVDRTAAEVVKLRYFCGMSMSELANVLAISPRTADRVWAYARAWLHHEIYGG
jgi:RNA polymerase sigma factor (TIGR02999 family)